MTPKQRRLIICAEAARTCGHSDASRPCERCWVELTTYLRELRNDVTIDMSGLDVHADLRPLRATMGLDG